MTYRTKGDKLQTKNSARNFRFGLKHDFPIRMKSKMKIMRIKKRMDTFDNFQISFFQQMKQRSTEFGRNSFPAHTQTITVVKTQTDKSTEVVSTKESLNTHTKKNESIQADKNFSIIIDPIDHVCLLERMTCIHYYHCNNI